MNELQITLLIVWAIGWILACGYTLNKFYNSDFPDGDAVPLIFVTALWPVWIPFYLSYKLWEKALR